MPQPVTLKKLKLNGSMKTNFSRKGNSALWVSDSFIPGINLNKLISVTS